MDASMGASLPWPAWVFVIAVPGIVVVPLTVFVYRILRKAVSRAA
jgi:hypothetical protein